MKKNDPLQESLVRAVSATFENIAFEEPEVLPAPVIIEGETISFSLQVVSPYLLTAAIEVPKKLAAKLAGTIYQNEEQEISDVILDDAVGELLNTIIGTMMGDVTLGERIFEMGLPRKITSEESSPLGNIRISCFRIEELPFCMTISGDVFVDQE